MKSKVLIVGLLVGALCLAGLSSALAYNEAPMLRVMVAAGELPPVEERLPEEPLVVKPLEEIGQYGGELKGIWVDTFTTDVLSARFQPLLMLQSDWKTVTPNIAKGWDFSEDLKTFTLYLRKGMRWSDGYPFTADDIMFWWEDIMLNEELTPSLRDTWVPGGEVMKLEKVDDYTLRFEFAVPYPVIIAHLSNPGSSPGFIAQPKHYVKKWHIKYNPEADDIAKEEGFDHWYQSFVNHQNSFNWNQPEEDINLPTLNPWKIARVSLNQRVSERNPYYWKVDTEGNQLPYIDKQIAIHVETPEMAYLKMTAGELDYGSVYSNIALYPLLTTNAEKGDYRVSIWKGGRSTMVSFGFNQTHQDPVLRKIFQDLRFRQAMSVAINREEMNDTFMYGEATTYKGVVLPSSSFYEPWMGEYYTQYDPQLANDLLDEMGLDKRDKDGYRLRPDGKQLIVHMEVPTGWGVFHKNQEVIRDYWEEVGVKVSYKILAYGLWSERRNGNELDAEMDGINTTSDFAIWRSGAGYLGSDLNPYRLWTNWFSTKGEKGEEPPDDFKRMQVLCNELPLLRLGSERFIEVGREIATWKTKKLFVIGSFGQMPIPMVAKNNLRNFPPEGSLWISRIMYWMPYGADTWFFKK